MSIMPRLTWTSPFLSIAWLLLAVRAGVAQGSNPVRLAPPDGLLAIVVEGKYGFIDLEGRVIIPPAFDVAGQFSEGLASAWLNGRAGFIDRTGKFVIPPRFIYAKSFREGLAEVRADKQTICGAL